MGDMPSRDEIARVLWTVKTNDDSYWSHQVAPTLSPDDQCERMADAVRDFLMDWL